MIYKFTSPNQTIISHKAFIEQFNIKKHQLYTLMKNNPFVINNTEFYHQPITDKAELKQVMPHLFVGRPKKEHNPYNHRKINEPKPDERINAHPPQNQFYYETVGQWTLKKSTLTNRLISSTFNNE